jgi:hypothetical protein
MKRRRKNPPRTLEEELKKKWKEELKKRKKAGVIHVKNGVAATESWRQEEMKKLGSAAGFF